MGEGRNEMSNQPKALWLAEELDGLPAGDFCEALGDEAAAELRRLHKLNVELLAVLKAMMAFAPDATCEIMHELHTRCRDAIAKTE